MAAFEISKTLTKQELADLEAAVPKHEVCAQYDERTCLAHTLRWLWLAWPAQS